MVEDTKTNTSEFPVTDPIRNDIEKISESNFGAQKGTSLPSKQSPLAQEKQDSQKELKAIREKVDDYPSALAEIEKKLQHFEQTGTENRPSLEGLYEEIDLLSRELLKLKNKTQTSKDKTHFQKRKKAKYYSQANEITQSLESLTTTVDREPNSVQEVTLPTIENLAKKIDVFHLEWNNRDTGEFREKIRKLSDKVNNILNSRKDIRHQVHDTADKTEKILRSVINTLNQPTKEASNESGEKTIEEFLFIMKGKEPLGKVFLQAILDSLPSARAATEFSISNTYPLEKFNEKYKIDNIYKDLEELVEFNKKFKNAYSLLSLTRFKQTINRLQKKWENPYNKDLKEKFIILQNNIKMETIRTHFKRIISILLPYTPHHKRGKNRDTYDPRFLSSPPLAKKRNDPDSMQPNP
jgi:chromosome segregation ATPase